MPPEARRAPALDAQAIGAGRGAARRPVARRLVGEDEAPLREYRSQVA